MVELNQIVSFDIVIAVDLIDFDPFSFSILQNLINIWCVSNLCLRKYVHVFLLKSSTIINNAYLLSLTDVIPVGARHHMIELRF